MPAPSGGSSTQHDVRVFFTAPTAFRAIKREDPDGALIRARDLSPFRALFLAGERADPPTVAWAEEQLKVPVIDHWWQTETGWPIGANCLGHRAAAGQARLVHPRRAGLGRAGAGGRGGSARRARCKPGEIGALAIKLPLPPGALPTLWQADERFVESYLSAYPGYYQTADAGFIDADGYIHVMTRTDDIINVAAHRLSTGEIEEVVAAHPDVAECAVMGVADPLKGQVPLGLLVLKAGVDAAGRPRSRTRWWRWCAQRIGPVASFKSRARRRAPAEDPLRQDPARHDARVSPTARTYRMPATIDDPAILDEIGEALARAGLSAARRQAPLGR